MSNDLNYGVSAPSAAYNSVMSPESYRPTSPNSANVPSYISGTPSEDTEYGIPMERRGRKRHGVWDHFEKVDLKAQCKYCSKVVRARPSETMRSHLYACEAALAANVNLDEVFPEGSPPSPTGGHSDEHHHTQQGNHTYVPLKPKMEGKVKKIIPSKQSSVGHRFQSYSVPFSFPKTPSAVDYSVYLVTDAGLVPSGSTVAEHVRMAISNGTTIVQLREKHADTRKFIEIAHEVHRITAAANVPLIINDRVDVAIAIDAEGVHVGQDDMDVPTVRGFLNNPLKIVGVSCHDAQELEAAIKDGADYVGIGAVFGTQTKELKKAPIGVYGLKSLLTLNAGRVKTVAIGGINHSNVQRVIYGSTPYSPEWRLDGVAVVSCIMASQNPGVASKSLARLVASKAPWESHKPPQVTSATSTSDLISLIPLVIKQVRQTRPLLHHITNNVVKNFSANVSIAIGASPAMSESADEFADFSKVNNAGLLINMGMPSAAGLEMYQSAIREYNMRGKPVVFDPVGVGASGLRKSACRTLLESSVFHVVKGNEGEIYTAAGVASEGAIIQGVDSIGSSSLESRVKATCALAKQFRTTVLMTGPQDVLVDATGLLVAVCDNGHDYMGNITGSGCSLGSVISACVAVIPNDPFLATAAALMMYTVAGERAAALPSVRGPGTFLPAFVDELYQISQETQRDDFKWIDRGKLKFHKLTNQRTQ